MTATTQRTTAEDLLAMPDDGFRYELVRGELRKMSPAGQFHGEYASSIHISLGWHAKANGLGKVYSSDTGFRLAADLVRAPDVSFVRRERAEAVKDTPGFFPGAPDLAVEVISPSDRYVDVDEKVADYLDAGALAVIVVNPRRRTVSVHRPAGSVVLTEADTLEMDDVVPGWRMAVREVFEWDA